MSKYYKKYDEKFIYVNLSRCIVVLHTRLSDIYICICNILNLHFEGVTKYLKVENLISSV